MYQTLRLQLFYHFFLQTPFVLTLEGAKATCSNEDFIKNVEVKVGTDGPLATLNIKYDIVKEIPQDAIVSITKFILWSTFFFKVNSYSDGQKFLRLWNPEVHYWVHKYHNLTLSGVG